MGQKVHPLGFRLPTTASWASTWFGQGNQYTSLFINDLQLREYIQALFKNRGQACSVRIQRYPEKTKILIKVIKDKQKKLDFLSYLTSRLFFLTTAWGEKAPESSRLSKLALPKLEIQLEFLNLQNSKLEAPFIAHDIARSFLLKKKTPNLNQRIRKLWEEHKKDRKWPETKKLTGIRILCTGRIQGAEMARNDKIQEGNLPLQRVASKIDYGFSEAHTTHGSIGVKVWLAWEDSVKERNATTAQF